MRNTPTLLFVPLEARLAWDGRIRTADAQALTVIHTKAEMGQTDDALLSVLDADPSYRAGFRDAFGHDASMADVGHALAAYEVATMVPEDAPLDRFARGELPRLSDDAMRGFDIFSGKGRCSRCHTPPVFSGVRPSDFTAPVFGVLGVPRAPGVAELDSDVGRFAQTHLERDRGAFRTPTVRNVARTAPYFHHGKFPTLESVLDFYDRGGGLGLGLAVPNQDPDVRPLHLSADERKALLTFMDQALSNVVR